MMKACVLLAAAAAVLSAAPAAAQNCRTVRYDPEAPARTSRRHAEDSTRLALRDEVRDTLAARFRAAALEAGVAEPAGLVVVEIRDRRRGTAEVTPHASNVSYAVLRGVVDAHAELIARWPERDGVFNLRLDRPYRPAPTEVAREAVECQPSIVDLNRLRRDLDVLSRRQGPLAPGQDPRVELRVRMLVSRNGDVAYARLAGRGVRPALNEAVLELARQIRFNPASVNGVPVDVWVELPFQFVLPVGPS